MRLYGIWIDEFSCGGCGGAHVLTHWHADHTAGLTKTFACPLYCTAITARVMKLSRTEVKVRPVAVGSTHALNKSEPVTFFDANHMRGSVMLYFAKRKTLYTSDFRYTPEMGIALKTKIGSVRDLYVDGTFHSPELRFMSEEDSIVAFLAALDRAPGPVGVVAHHAGTVEIMDKANVDFVIDRSISPKLRDVLKTMYGKRVKRSANVRVVNPKRLKDERKLSVMIIPSSLWYACEGNAKFARKAQVFDRNGHLRINFTRHSDYTDNLALAEMLQAKNVFVIGKTKSGLRCT